MKFVIVAGVLVAGGCSASESATGSNAKPLPAPGVEACSRPVLNSQRVTIAELISNPRRFEGSAVRVDGYYRWGFEHSAVYTNKEDAEHHRTEKGIWVQADVPRELRGRDIMVEAIFTAQARGHLSQWAGTLCGVTRLEQSQSEMPNDGTLGAAPNKSP